MSRRVDDLPTGIEKDAGSLITTLRTGGWTVGGFHYDAAVMGSWYVELTCQGSSLRLVKDRSQFSVSGPPIDDLTAAGLWRAFDDPADFHRAVIDWALNKPQV